MNRLKEHGCTPEEIIKTPIADLEAYIYPVGFYKRKAKYLHDLTEILIEKYDGDIPKTSKELKELPGVGTKVAQLVLQIAWDIVEGISVDVHVHRISNRLKWVKTTEPDKTKDELEKFLPKYNSYFLYNHIENIGDL